MLEEFWYKLKSTLLKLANFKKRSRTKRYLFPVVLIFIAAVLIFTLPKPYFLLINNQVLSFLIFTTVVVASAWFGGFGPGLFATLFAALVNYFTLLKWDAAIQPFTGDLLLSAIFIVEGLVISIISEVRYQAEFQKDEFIGFAAHELKNPLTTIKVYASLLNRYFEKTKKDKYSQITQSIESQSDRILELINDLLDVTQIEVGKFDYEEDLFDFDNLVEETVGHQRIIDPKREIILTGQCKRIIRGDKYRLGQVITNLLTNALKYSPKDAPVKVKIKSNRETVSLSVTDFGIGVPKGEFKSIFREFYRTGAPQKVKAQGAGLGLFISTRIVNHHHGKIWVKSDGISGSTFFLELPKGH